MEEVREVIARGRSFLRANWAQFTHVDSDQERGVPAPPLQKPLPPDAQVVTLPDQGSLALGSMPVSEAIRNRKSRRKYSAEFLSREELSFLLWATQGVRRRSPINTLRTVPSGGARHALETYLYLTRVAGIGEGLYRYLPLDHALLVLPGPEGLAGRLDEALFEQSWDAAAVFVWAAVPYRMEWRYSWVSHKIIALDAGHVCQNLYLACEALGCGTCAIGAYDQEKLDALLGLDATEEFSVYAAPVGRQIDRAATP